VLSIVTTCLCRTKGDEVDLRRAFLRMHLFSLVSHHPTNALYSSIIDLELCVRSYTSLNIGLRVKSPNIKHPSTKEDSVIFIEDKWNFEKCVGIFDRFFDGTFGSI
jgi:hypothetical protein